MRKCDVDKRKTASGNGTLSRIPLAQLQGGETLVTMPVGSVGTAQGGLLANASSLGGTYATGAVAPSTIPATNALNSYTATGVGTTLTASGKPKFGYAQSPGILIDGAVRSYQAGAALQEVSNCWEIGWVFFAFTNTPIDSILY